MWLGCFSRLARSRARTGRAPTAGYDPVTAEPRSLPTMDVRMHRTTLLVLILAACAPAPTPRAELDRRSERYIEDEPGGRGLAGVELVLERVESGAQLALRLAADGPRVDAIHGIEGRRGVNRITARELTRLEQERGIEIRTTRRDASEVGAHVGAVSIVRAGRLPERRVAPDGSIDLEAASHETFALELALSAAPVGAGEWRTELWVGGRPRLRVDYQFDGRTGRIQAFDRNPVPHREELAP